MAHKQFFDELKKDHKEVKGLLDELASISPQKGQLFQQLRREIVPHMQAEEDTLYNMLMQNEDSRHLAFKGIEEHNLVKTVMGELDQTSFDERWKARIGVLRTMVNQHIKEEESDVFDAAKKLSEAQIDEVATSFDRVKQQIKTTVM